MLLCAFAFAGGVLVVVFCEGRATHKMRDLRAFFVGSTERYSQLNQLVGRGPSAGGGGVMLFLPLHHTRPLGTTLASSINKNKQIEDFD